MADPVNVHFRMVDEQESIRRMKEAIQALNDAGIEYAGCWGPRSR